MIVAHQEDCPALEYGTCLCRAAEQLRELVEAASGLLPKLDWVDVLDLPEVERLDVALQPFRKEESPIAKR